MADIGDLKWTIFPVEPEEVEFFLGKTSDHGHTPGMCSVCSEPLDLESDPLDFHVQWANQLVPLYGWVERGETWYGHKLCLVSDRPASLPLVQMPEMFCDQCGAKMTDTRIGVNDHNFCSMPCLAKSGFRLKGVPFP